MKAVVFDYGAGNLHSLSRALASVGLTVRVDVDAARAVKDSDVLVLPGVGAFGHAADRIGDARATLHDALRSGHPCIGICLGMQLLFASSDEGCGSGIGLVDGRVKRLTTRRLPHMGWSLVEGFGEMYFAHSYVCHPANAEVVTGRASHEGESFAAMIRVGRTVGVQFHPEKSSRAGLSLLDRLCREVLS